MGGNIIRYCLPIFLHFYKDIENGEVMKHIKFNTLNDAIECYGRENLIAIDTLKQAIFYTKMGCQPKFIYENETKPGRVSFWFLKAETAFVYKKWMTSQPRKLNNGKCRKTV